MHLNKESGLTLIETLAVTVIASIVLLLLYSIISQSSNTHQKQTTANTEIKDAAYALKVITKDIRKHPGNVTLPSDTELKIEPATEPEIRFVFNKEQKIIERNGQILSTGINDFLVSNITLEELADTQNNASSPNSNLISIQITNLQGRTYSTELYLRKGSPY
ncbi:PilW family protein [Lysinibacillus sp. NPDC097287]|uniref:PilW family protein n=1 Tax=Lysinibacillus sp. NPDC097287 TaxID=3364144 RepID=UPI003805A407